MLEFLRTKANKRSCGISPATRADYRIVYTHARDGYSLSRAPCRKKLESCTGRCGADQGTAQKSRFPQSPGALTPPAINTGWQTRRCVGPHTCQHSPIPLDAIRMSLWVRAPSPGREYFSSESMKPAQSDAKPIRFRSWYPKN